MKPEVHISSRRRIELKEITAQLQALIDEQVFGEGLRLQVLLQPGREPRKPGPAGRPATKKLGVTRPAAAWPTE